MASAGPEYSAISASPRLGLSSLPAELMIQILEHVIDSTVPTVPEPYIALSEDVLAIFHINRHIRQQALLVVPQLHKAVIKRNAGLWQALHRARGRQHHLEDIRKWRQFQYIRWQDTEEDVQGYRSACREEMSVYKECMAFQDLLWILS